MLIEILTVVAPVFVITALGYVWARAGRAFDMETVGPLVLYVGTPCLVYSSFVSFEVDAGSFGRMALAGAACLFVAGVLATVLLLLGRLSLSAFLPGLMHSNAGNVGIPIAFLAFGDQGLALAVSFFFVVALSQYTVGLAIASGEADIRVLLRQPLVWAVALALVTILTGLEPPDWIRTTTTMLGNITIPLMVILLGVSLARLQASHLGLSLGLAVARLAIGIASGLGVVALLDLSGAEAGVVFLLAAMPASIFSFVFAERFKREPDKVASMILASTLLTFAAMPALVWVALRMGAA